MPASAVGVAPSWPKFDSHELVASTIHRRPSRTGCFLPGSLVLRWMVTYPREFLGVIDRCCIATRSRTRMSKLASMTASDASAAES